MSHPLRRARSLATLTLAIVTLAYGAPPILSATLDPTRLQPADIGSPSAAGRTEATDTTLRIAAGGRGIGFKSDQFHFASAAIAGNFDVCVRVTALRNTDLWAKAGLMLRDGTGVDAPFAAVFTTPSGAGCIFQSRLASGGSATNSGSFPANQPLTWLRLRRSGNTLAGFAGIDGTHWTALGSRALSLTATPQLGLAVTSHNTNAPTLAEFHDLGDVANPDLRPIPSTAESLGPSSRRTSLVISEIMFHPAPSADGRQLEFVELYNSQPYFEDLSGWKLAGDIDFAFPPGTTLPGGGFLVVAAAPADLVAAYGLAPSGVLGPYKRHLNNQGGQLRLLGDRDAVLLDAVFSDRAPWPELAGGSGHSIVLSHPSRGETDPRAWAASRVIGGSPGAPEAVEILPTSFLRLNECQLPDDAGRGFVEIFNAGPIEADLAGLRIGSSPSSMTFVIPTGTRLASGGFTAFTWSELGFAAKTTGDRIYLGATDGARFLDAVTFAPQFPGTSAGRWPNGGNAIRTLPQPTPGTPNPHPKPTLAINETHPAPTSGRVDEEFVELFNADSTDIDLAGWKFTSGIAFTFPTGARIAAGGYLVVARNTTRLRELHPGLDPTKLLGDFTGGLSSRGEQLVLSRPVTVRNGTKNETVFAPAAEASLNAGGRWSPWAAGGGSTLELTDPRANANLESSWASSNESTRGEWTTVEFRGVLDNGASGVRPDSLHIYLMGEGECLVDNVEVIGPGNTNRIPNSTFENGLTGWTPSGNHVRSSLETSEGDNSSSSLHLRASGNGDTGANKVYAKLTSALATGNTATLRARVKWLRGWPEILLRLHGNYLEAYGRLDAPAGPGTPGSRNSTAVDNAGPAFDHVTHFPAVPATDQPVTVTALIDDPDGIGSVTLRYRTDPSSTPTEIPMHDDGTGGDAVPGDGIYSAVIPATGAARLVAFTLVAKDQAAAPASSTFPPGSPQKECLVRFGDPTQSGAFGTYRLWFTQANSDVWKNRPILSNEPVDGTFVYANTRVVYNIGARFAGSPFHQQFAAGPGSEAHFVVDVPRTEQVIGATSFNKIHAPGNSPFDDNALQREQAVYWMARKSGLPSLHRRFVHLVVNGTRKRTLMEDTQVGSDDLVSEFWPDDTAGNLFKLQPWFEFPDSTSQNLQMQNNTFLAFGRYTTTAGQLKLARYRCNWLVRGADGTANDFTNVIQLNTAATDTSNPRYESNIEQLADVDEWFRAFAVNHAVGNWDSVGYRNGQNTYAYKPVNGRWELFLWDANIVLGNGSDGPGSLPLFTGSDGTLTRWFSSGTFRRRFRSAYYELATGPMLASAIGPMLEAKYAAFQEHGITAANSSTLLTFINSARANILSQLSKDTAPFAITDVTGTGPFTLSGNGPLNMTALSIDGVSVPLTWTSTKTWTAVATPAALAGKVNVAALNRFGEPLPGIPQDLRLTQPGSLSLRPGTAEWLLEYPATHAGPYRLEATPAVPASNWQTVETKTATGLGVLQFHVPMTPRDPLFFRIAEP